MIRFPHCCRVDFSAAGGKMREQGVTVCSSGNEPIGVEPPNIYAASLAGTPKNVLSIERMSPASVDSGFDSSFPSSPDCSLDSSVGIGGAEMTKYCKDSNFKRRHQVATTLTGTILQCYDTVVVSQCPLSLFQPLCSALSSPISRTSSDISTFSTSSSSSADTKIDENFCLDACILNKTTSLTSLSSLQLAVDVPVNQESGILPTTKLGNSVRSLAECSTVPSSSGCISTEVNEPELRVRCHWKSCTERFASDNDLYDHVVKAHLELLRSSVYLDGNNNGSSNGGGSQTQTIGRLKNLMCQWGSCKMGLSRGDFQKQFIWLEEHFTTRHAGKAQPYMCLIEGCSLRFTLKRSLEEHLRTGHEKTKVKRPHTEEGELSRAKSCYQWTPLPYYIPSEKNDFLDHATEEWIVMRLRQYERTNGASFIPREPATPRGGAAYRKRRRILTFAIEPLKIAPKVISDTMGLADAKSLIKSAFISSESCTNSVDRTTVDGI
uniref:C2H2-type domain-containing protein n=1 Tax=Setaria digitata TaxID=48799 RepID=A0A915PN52_9BILA